MPTIAELKEKREAARKEIYQLRDVVSKENREFKPEEQTRWDAANTEYNKFNRQIDVLETGERIEREMSSPPDDRGIGRDDRSGQPGQRGKPGNKHRQRQLGGDGGEAAITNEQRALALQAWAQGRSRTHRREHAEACRRTRIDPYKRNLRTKIAPTGYVRQIQQVFRSTHPSAVERALQTLSGPAGGYLVANEFVRALEIAQVTFGGMLQVCDVIRTATGAEMAWPTSDDSANEGEIIGEDQDATALDPTFGQQIWRAFLYSSKVIKVSTSLLEDSAIDLAGELGRMIGERLGRIHNRHFTSGTGANQPRGIVTDAATGKTTASGTAITAEEVIDLIASVDPAYRVNARFMAHDSIFFYLRKLKDSQGRFLWDSDIRAGMPDRIWGYPTAINMSMASTVATTNVTALFGDFSKYKVRMVNGIRLKRLEELFALRDQVGFLAFVRADGKLLTVGNPVKKLVQA